MLTIDLRMYCMSGIGRYLRNLVPLVIPRLLADRIRVIGDPSQFASSSWINDPRVELFESRANIYSIKEQALAWSGAFRGTELLWVPHYSVPLLYNGLLAVTIHDVCHLALPELLGSSLKRSYAALLFENVARKADAVFCVSEFTSKEVQKYLHISANRIHVTRPGLDAMWDPRLAPHKEQDLPPYFLYVGNVKPNKNLTMLMRAFRQVMHRIPHRLMIVGKMSEMRTVDDAVILEAKNFGDRVHMTGAVSDEQLMKYYRSAEALVVPSLYEGFGLPLLEAMSLGCPVLCSSASSLPEVAGDAAVYFDPRDARDIAEKLLQIAANPALRMALVEKGSDRLRKFRYEDCAGLTAEVLNKLMMRN